MADPEDPPAEADQREGDSSPNMDAEQREGDLTAPEKHDEPQSAPYAVEPSLDESDQNNRSMSDTDDRSPDDNQGDKSNDNAPDDTSSDGDSPDARSNCPDNKPDDTDPEDNAVEQDATDDAQDSSQHEPADHDEGDDEDDEGDEGEDDEGDEDEGTDDDEGSAKPLPPMEPASSMELMAAYRQPATAGGERLPWSWATLSPAERATSATLIDGFVESYNHTWAISKEQAVPPCWHRHPALAHDLAALAWAYYQAYRDPTATPDRALRFQAELLPFAKRMNRWLGRKPGECRGGRHADSWRDAEGITSASRRSTSADTDAVTLLGEETFGFVQQREAADGPIADA